jgi:phospholipid/cholesterol/gamma-HCH transport system substrate-binding protein
MVQSASSSKVVSGERYPAPPPRTFTTEFMVGLFALAGVAASGWLAVGLGGISLFDTNHYQVMAEFDNISGLKKGASVEIAGVQIGDVSDIKLKDPVALITMNIRNDVLIKDDDIFSIRTKGIIGDRFVKISRGGSDVVVKPGATVTETESSVDIEDIIGKIVHSLSGEKDSATAPKATPSVG